VLQLAEEARAETLLEGFDNVPGLKDTVHALDVDTSSPGAMAAACELVLEALVAEKRITRNEAGRYVRGKRRPPGGPQFPGTLDV
ncbi:MAG TPA: hypothetical protein VK966_01755, partial [Longimicrobiales bacterium]|nr:hypothetical protein [Longimicrobiales bacterium]